ncbi:MAG: chloride channel protein [Clostridiales bacterium]|nr:chloride channel protein [Clostridiales bacterium]
MGAKDKNSGKHETHGAKADVANRAANELKLWLFCALVGGFAGLIIWVFLKLMSLGMEFFWEWLPSRMDMPFYTLAVCTVGGLVIGLVRKWTGDYPEELSTVFGKLRRDGTYEYRNMPALLLTALLPLIIGSSIGPEAGMTGIIVGLCCWAGDNLKFARQHSKEYSRIGMAVTLSVLFHSPLFGIFSVEENGELGDDDAFSLSLSSKLLIYGLAIAAAMGIYLLLSALFGAGMGGFPSFTAPEAGYRDYLMMVVYILAGCLLAKFYDITHHMTGVAAGKVPNVLKETLGGLCMGLVATFVPMMMFSGEEEMGELMTDYVEYLPLFLIGVAFLKVLITNVCIQSGLKGGHFFPVIFAGVCLGYGLAMFVFPAGGHEVFGAAVVTAALLGGIMKKPLAVSVLLFLCFPVRMFVWIFLAAAIGAKLIGKGDAERNGQGNAE